MKRTTDKRVGILRSLFLSDPYRKLIAVGFAVGLWFFLDSQVTATDQMDLGLDSLEDSREDQWLVTGPSPDRLWVKVPPARWTVAGFQNAVTGEEISGVRLDFSGPKHVIERIREEKLLFIAVNPAGNDVADLRQQGGFEFTVDDVRALSDFQAPIQHMSPERVKVVLEYNKEQPVQLSHDLISFDLPDHVSEEDQENYRNRIRLSQADFSDLVVVLYGPEDEISGLLNEPKLFRVSLSERAPGQVGGNLVLLEKFRHFSMAPELLNVSLPLELEPTEYTLWVPVSVDDLALPRAAQGRYGPAEPVMQIILLASGDLNDLLIAAGTDAAQQAWANEHLRLHVPLAPGFDPNLNFHNAELLIPNLPIDPRYYRLQDRVTVTIVEK